MRTRQTPAIAEAPNIDIDKARRFRVECPITRVVKRVEENGRNGLVRAGPCSSFSGLYSSWQASVDALLLLPRLGLHRGRSAPHHGRPPLEPARPPWHDSLDESIGRNLLSSVDCAARTQRTGRVPQDARSPRGTGDRGSNRPTIIQQTSNPPRRPRRVQTRHPHTAPASPDLTASRPMPVRQKAAQMPCARTPRPDQWESRLVFTNSLRPNNLNAFSAPFFWMFSGAQNKAEHPESPPFPHLIGARAYPVYQRA